MAAHQAVREWRTLEACIEEYDDNPIELRDRADGMARRGSRQKNIIVYCRLCSQNHGNRLHVQTAHQRTPLSITCSWRIVIRKSSTERARLEMVLKEITRQIERYEEELRTIQPQSGQE
ncbi:unnamed protein product [Nippostrongylus brasiliensis]|uniref:Zn_ribbon_recom domain-containing protein n=1 Tax=Nippostrongylus brasiliensis TaxID=27835 RepID=A0A0N4XCB7_NIPBR|nr:unnamed protein product [Nippostrongylus brasiliensis]